jgi:hypothetical protein
LRRLVPEGVDVLFDSVGGKLLDDLLTTMAVHGRVVLCGASAIYESPLDVCVSGKGLLNVIYRRITLQGSVAAADFLEKNSDEAAIELSSGIDDGWIRIDFESVGSLEDAPFALDSLMATGANGRVLVRLA